MQVVLARRRRDELEHLGVFEGLALLHQYVARAEDEDRIGVRGRLRFNRLGLVLHRRQRPEFFHDRWCSGLRAVAFKGELALVPEERRETFPVRIEEIVVVRDKCFCYVVGGPARESISIEVVASMA